MQSALLSDAAAICDDAAAETKRRNRRQHNGWKKLDKDVVDFSSAHPNAQVVLVVASAYRDHIAVSRACGPMTKDPVFTTELMDLVQTQVLAQRVRPDSARRVAISDARCDGYASVGDTLRDAVKDGELGEQQAQRLLARAKRLHAGKWSCHPLLRCARGMWAPAKTANPTPAAAAKRDKKLRVPGAFGARGAAASQPTSATLAAAGSEDELGAAAVTAPLLPVSFLATPHSQCQPCAYECRERGRQQRRR